MAFRIATLNMEQNHKRWELRRELIIQQLAELRPNLLALNEICVPLQTGRWLQHEVRKLYDLKYSLVQQTKTNGSSLADAEGILTSFPLTETANLDYRAWDAVALVTRLEIEDRQVDVYVTHLHRSVGADSIRLYQVQQLLEWINERDDVEHQVVCGDFNATLDMPSAQLMTSRFEPAQTEPTAFTPLAEVNGELSHPSWERMDRCIDYIWASRNLKVLTSGLCFNRPSPEDASLWPSDHVGVWADIEF